MSEKKASTRRTSQRARVKANDVIVTTKLIKDRMAYPIRNGAPGTLVTTIKKGKRLVAATNEIGGNVFVHARADSEPVIVPLAEDEWKPA